MKRLRSKRLRRIKAALDEAAEFTRQIRDPVERLILDSLRLVGILEGARFVVHLVVPHWPTVHLSRALFGMLAR